MQSIKTVAKRILRGNSLAERALGIYRQRVSHSQFGEDLQLRSYYERLFQDRKIVVNGGCIVDIGCFHPIILSNTFYFYKKGWHSINIDPTPGSKQIFDKIRPKDTNLELAIAPENGSSTFFLFGTPSPWNTMDVDMAKHASAMTGITPKQIPITMCRLDEVLDKYVGDQPFELLSIDVAAGGTDGAHLIEILKSNSFSKYRPRLIMVDIYDLFIESLAEHPIVIYLKNFGYTLHSWLNPTIMFVRDDSRLKSGSIRAIGVSSSTEHDSTAPVV
jgi:hypothetical protein